MNKGISEAREGGASGGPVTGNDPVNGTDPTGLCELNCTTGNAEVDRLMRQGIDALARQSAVYYLNGDLTLSTGKGGFDIAFSFALEKTEYMFSGAGLFLSTADGRLNTDAWTAPGSGYFNNLDHTLTGVHGGAGVNLGFASGSFGDFGGSVRAYSGDVGPLGLSTFAPTEYRSFSEVANAAASGVPSAGFELGVAGAGLGASRGEVDTVPLIVFRLPNSPGFEDYGWVQTMTERPQK